MPALLPDISKTLQELDGQDWGEPVWQSGLVTECHRLHQTPLRDFEPDDFRRMIGQSFCLEHLVPLAMELVKAEPLLEGMCFPGDLLCALLRSDHAFWASNPELQDELSEVAEAAKHSIAQMSEKESNVIAEALEEASAHFERNKER